MNSHVYYYFIVIVYDYCVWVVLWCVGSFLLILFIFCWCMNFHVYCNTFCYNIILDGSMDLLISPTD